MSMRQLTGERRSGINTQGKIHAKIVVGADGRVWFASKQAHEIFDTRPEYGEDGDGFPGGHLCYFDPKTGFSRSMGILKKQEGVVAGAIDDKRGKLYYRSEPKNVFLVYDIRPARCANAVTSALPAVTWRWIARSRLHRRPGGDALPVRSGDGLRRGPRGQGGGRGRL